MKHCFHNANPFWITHDRARGNWTQKSIDLRNRGSVSIVLNYGVFQESVKAEMSVFRSCVTTYVAAGISQAAITLRM
jgi:hypothetical protein